jgi:predicted RND superfamily exporter protein
LKKNQTINRAISIFLLAAIFVLTFFILRNLEGDPYQQLTKNDPDQVAYGQFKDKFKSATEEESIFITVANNKGIFQQDFLEKVDSLAKFLVKTKHVLRVYSLTGMHVIFYNGWDIEARPLVHISQPGFYSSDSAYIFQSKEYRDLLISRDGHAIAIGAFHDTALSRKQKKQLIDSIRTKINELEFDQSHFVSRITIEQNSKEKIIFILLFLVIVLVVFHLSVRRSFRQLQTVLAKRLISACLLISIFVIGFFISYHEFNIRIRDLAWGKTKTDLEFIDKNFYGSRPFELVLSINDGQKNFYEPGMMKKIGEIENYLRDSLNAGAIITPASLFKGANKAFHGDQIAYFKIPDSTHLISRFAEAIYQTEYADEMERWMVRDGSNIRITARFPDAGSRAFRSTIQKIETFLAQKNYSDHFSYRFTGKAMVFDKWIGPMVKNILLISTGLLLISLGINFFILKTSANKNHLLG